MSFRSLTVGFGSRGSGLVRRELLVQHRLMSLVRKEEPKFARPPWDLGVLKRRPAKSWRCIVDGIDFDLLEEHLRTTRSPGSEWTLKEVRAIIKEFHEAKQKGQTYVLPEKRSPSYYKRVVESIIQAIFNGTLNETVRTIPVDYYKFYEIMVKNAELEKNIELEFSKFSDSKKLAQDTSDLSEEDLKREFYLKKWKNIVEAIENPYVYIDLLFNLDVRMAQLVAKMWNSFDLDLLDDGIRANLRTVATSAFQVLSEDAAKFYFRRGLNTQIPMIDPNQEVIGFPHLSEKFNSKSSGITISISTSMSFVVGNPRQVVPGEHRARLDGKLSDLKNVLSADEIHCFKEIIHPRYNHTRDQFWFTSDEFPTVDENISECRRRLRGSLVEAKKLAKLFPNRDNGEIIQVDIPNTLRANLQLIRETLPIETRVNDADTFTGVNHEFNLSYIRSFFDIDPRQEPYVEKLYEFAHGHDYDYVVEDQDYKVRPAESEFSLQL